MILSKAALQAVELSRADKKIPLVDMVCITKDGDVVATNGSCMVAVERLPGEVMKALPLTKVGKDGGALEGDCIYRSDAIREVIKNITVDKTFNGMMEFAAFTEDGSDVVVLDGKREKKIGIKKFTDWIPFRKLMRDFLWRESEKRIIFDLRRLSVLVQTINKICPDKDGVMPVYVEFAKGVMILRTKNYMTGQNVLAIMNDNKGQWIQNTDEWEKRLTRSGSAKKKRT